MLKEKTAIYKICIFFDFGQARKPRQSGIIANYWIHTVIVGNYEKPLKEMPYYP